MVLILPNILNKKKKECWAEGVNSEPCGLRHTGSHVFGMCAMKNALATRPEHQENGRGRTRTTKMSLAHQLSGCEPLQTRFEVEQSSFEFRAGNLEQ